MAGDVLAVEGDGAGGGWTQPEDDLAQLGLPVALDACDGEDLAGAHVQVDVLEQDGAVLDEADALQGEPAVPGFGRWLVDGQGDVMADHEAGELGGRGGGLGGADDTAAADDGDGVGDLADLAQLVGDEDDGGARGLELAHDGDELVGLLRGEHGGGLVEDEDLGVSGQGLDDLHALLDTHGQVLNEGVGVDVEAEAAGDLGDLGRGGTGADDPQRPDRLVTQGDGLGHGEDGHEHEVLVDHADACGHGVARTGEGDGLVVDEDLSGVGLVEAVEGRS